MTIEECKATIEVEAYVVSDFRDVENGQATYLCPACGRRTAGSKTEPHRHTCGAVVTLKGD